MKFTMEGFSQKAAFELGLDTIDLHILRWCVDFMESGRMRTMKLDNETYFWVSYQGIVDDMPLLYLKKYAVYKRLKNMCKLNILKKKTVLSGGKFSYFTLGEQYAKLAYVEDYYNTDKNPIDDCENSSEKNASKGSSFCAQNSAQNPNQADRNFNQTDRNQNQSAQKSEQITNQLNTSVKSNFLDSNKEHKKNERGNFSQKPKPLCS